FCGLNRLLLARFIFLKDLTKVQLYTWIPPATDCSFMKFNFSLSFLIFVLWLSASCSRQNKEADNSRQNLNGNYFAYELIGLEIDTIGTIDFYGKDTFP